LLGNGELIRKRERDWVSTGRGGVNDRRKIKKNGASLNIELIDRCDLKRRGRREASSKNESNPRESHPNLPKGKKESRAQRQGQQFAP